MVFSVHIPKCGGTSFRSWLESGYGQSLAYDYSRRWEKNDQPLLRKRLEGKRCFHAHAACDALDGLYPEVVKITWIRNPVDRVTSYYNHILRGGESGNGYFRAVVEQRLSLIDFAGLPWVRNGLLAFVKNRPEQFAFIGIVEESRDSLLRLQCLDIIGEEFCFSEGLPELNKAGDEPQRKHAKSSADIRAAIAALNEADIRFYNNECRKHGYDSRVEGWVSQP